MNVMSVYDSAGNICHLLSPKLIKSITNKFFTQYQISMKLIFPGLGENREIGSAVGQTENETRSEYLKNSSNDFLQTRYVNTFLQVFQIGIIHLIQKVEEVQILKPDFTFRKYVSQKNKLNDFLQMAFKYSFLDVSSVVIVVYERKIDGSPNLVS